MRYIGSKTATLPAIQSIVAAHAPARKRNSISIGAKMTSIIISAVRGALNTAPRRHKLCNARLSGPDRFEKLCGAVNS